MREFPLTPLGKYTPRAKSVGNKREDPTISSTPVSIATTGTTSSPQTSPFKVDAESLHAILSGNGGEAPSLSQRATLAAWPRIIPGELRLPQTSYRYSMYRRRRVSPLWLVNLTRVGRLILNICNFNITKLFSKHDLCLSWYYAQLLIYPNFLPAMLIFSIILLLQYVYSITV